MSLYNTTHIFTRLTQHQSMTKPMTELLNNHNIIEYNNNTNNHNATTTTTNNNNNTHANIYHMIL